MNDADGHVQWVHEQDAALACVHALTHRGTLPVALNVVAPHVASRRALIETSLLPSQWPSMKPGGCQRTVSSKALEVWDLNGACRALNVGWPQCLAPRNTDVGRGLMAVFNGRGTDRGERQAEAEP